MSERQPRRRPAARACCVWMVAALALAAPGAASASPLYQWTDERGNVRYTPDPDRVPSSRRGSLVQLEPGMPAPPAPERRVPSAASAAPVSPPGAVPASREAAAAPPTATGAVPPAAARPPAATVAPLGSAEAAREQQLMAAIAADEDALKALLATPRGEGEAELSESAELRAIAQRLPGLQAELRALRERRAPPAQR